MPKSDSVSRMRNYDLKMTAQRVAEMVEKRKPEMIRKQDKAIKDLYRVELGVKEVLASEPVGIMDYLSYYNFARETYRLQERHLGGYALVREVQILIDKWAARRCDERVLHRIRFEVFGIQSEEEFQVVLERQVDPRVKTQDAPAATGSAQPVKRTRGRKAGEKKSEETPEAQ